MQDKGQGFLQDGTPMLWKWIRDKIVTLVGVLGTCLVIVEIGDRGKEWGIIGE